MSNEANYIDPEISGTGSTRSSQDTLCSQDTSKFVGQEDEPKEEKKACFISQPSNFKMFQNLTNEEPKNSTLPFDPCVYVDEDTQMCVGGESGIPDGSPNHLISPGCEPGDISSPFETMESDDHNDADDSLFSASSLGGRRHKWRAETFSTPRDSSDDDPYASSGSKKKRRRLKKEMHPSDNFAQSHMQYYSPSPQISSPISLQNGSENLHMHGVAGISKSRGTMPLMYNSDSNNMFPTILRNNRRASNASESNQSSISCTRDNSISVIENSLGANTSNFMVDGEVIQSAETSLTQTFSNSGIHEKSLSKSMSLQGQYPSSSNGFTLEILEQPEDQHRARYLTEGSRGPVKDHSQQSFPKLQLKGYTGKTTLHVYVGSDSEDKVRPHGFYQACKITGRNTTVCEEVEIEGTKVIQIPFDAQDPISVDCVGILKLRNADVELRIGPSRAKKRSQTVRLVFRVLLDVAGNDSLNPLILQVVSDRINCTQPRGQPEIIKKSLERCSVEGNQEMFIIGRNFHRGTKVIFQDSEEPDGSHWHQPGQIDKDTFNQSHLVVHIPPYHDQTITKSVNVQLYVEHDGRKCDPHSFTYDPSPRQVPKETTSQESDAKKESEDAIQSLLKIDRKLLEALFAKLTPTDPDYSDVTPASRPAPPVQVAPIVSSEASIAHSAQGQPLSFTSDKNQLSPSIQKPTAFSALNSNQVPVISRTLIRPTTFANNSFPTSTVASPMVSNNVVMTAQPFKLREDAMVPGVSVAAVSGAASSPFQVSATSVFDTVSAAASAKKGQTLVVKTEEQAQIWPSQDMSGPRLVRTNAGSSTITFSLPPNASFTNSESQQPVMIISNPPSVQQSGVNVVNQAVSSPAGQAKPPAMLSHVIHYTSTLPQQKSPLNASVANVVHVIDNSQSVQNSVTSPSKMFVSFSQEPSSSANANSIMVSNGFVANVPTSGSVHHVHGWIQDKSVPSLDEITPQNSSHSAMQWQSVPQQNCSNEPANLQHSSSGALIFSAASSHHNQSANQQQVFTITNAMEIFENQPKTNQSVSVDSQNADSVPFSNAISSLDQLSNPSVDANSHDLLTTGVLRDEDLQMNFDSNFQLSDSKGITDSSVLETIISDCLNASSGPVEGHVFPEKLLSPHEASNPDSPSQMSPFTPNLQLSQNPQIAVQPQPSPSSDVEMLPATLEKKKFESTKDCSNIFLCRTVNPSMFVNSISQPQHNQATSLTSADSLQDVSHAYSMPSPISTNLPLNSSSNKNVGNSTSTEVFQTIDPSVLNIDSGNSLNQTFSTFDQSQSSNNAGS